MGGGLQGGDLIYSATNTPIRDGQEIIGPSTKHGSLSQSQSQVHVHASSQLTIENDENIFNRSLKWAEQRDARMENERRKKEIEEFKECSFKPTVTSTPSSSGNTNNTSRRKNTTAVSGDDINTVVSNRTGTTGTGSLISGEDICRRNSEWSARREERLEQLRKEKEKEKMDGCTFAPTLSAFTTTTNTNTSSSSFASTSANRNPTVLANASV
jgi:hypothetical protein